MFHNFDYEYYYIVFTKCILFKYKTNSVLVKCILIVFKTI